MTAPSWLAGWEYPHGARDEMAMNEAQGTNHRGAGLADRDFGRRIRGGGRALSWTRDRDPDRHRHPDQLFRWDRRSVGCGGGASVGFRRSSSPLFRF